MQFTRWKNPNKRSRVRRPAHSEQYMNEMRDTLYRELAKCQTEAERENVIKAYHATINP